MRQVLTVLAIWAAGLGSAAQFGKISILYQDLQSHYAAAGPVGIGLMVSVVGMVGLIFGTTAGLAVARVGPRRAILWALALGAAVSAVQSVLPPYPVMMAARVLEGVSHLAIVVVGPTAIAGVASARMQGAAMTLWSSFFGLTYAILALIAPPIVAAGGDQALFWAHVGWMLACLVVLFVLMPPDPSGAAPRQVGNLWVQHVQIYTSPWVAAPAMGFVCYTITYVAVLTLLPPVMTPGWGNFAAVSMPLVSILVSLTLGVWLLGRVTAVHMVQAGFAVGIVATLTLYAVWGSGLPEALAALAVAAALGIVQGASFAALAQLNPSPTDRARGAGAIAQLGNLGTTTGTPLLAMILPAAGAAGLTAFLVGFCALGIAIHALQARRRLNG